MPRDILATLCALCAFAASAQLTVRGTVADSLGTPVDYATVRIFNPADTLNPLAAVVTAETGEFLITAPAEGAYLLTVSSVGYPMLREAINVDSLGADLGTLRMGASSMALGEVVVSAQRPIVTKEIDRIGYDVQADPETPVSTVDDILRKVPLVSVDGEGNIKVRGSSNFKIYKNGRPNNMFTNNAKDIFKAIPASTIKRIEVITDPGAREDAEGVAAILNIVTVDGSAVKGVMGQLNMDYNTTVPSYPGANGMLQTQVGNVNLSLSGGYQGITYRDLQSYNDERTTYTDTGNTLTNRQRTGYDHSDGGGMGFWNLEGSWEPDTLNLVTLEFGGYAYSLDATVDMDLDMRSPSGASLYSYKTYMRLPRQSYLDFNGAVNYQRSTRRKGETIVLSYQVSTTNQHVDYRQTYYDAVNLPTPYTGFNSNFTLDFWEHTFQADWSRPLATYHTLDVGAKYILRLNRSKTYLEYVGVGNDRSNFHHDTNIGALYADWRMKRGRLGLRAGLRYELSHISVDFLDGDGTDFTRNLSDWVPNASVSYDFTDRHSLKLSWSSRISRPGISYLNPAVMVLPYETQQGNPNLNSSRYYSPSLTYSMLAQRAQLYVTASYTYSNNALIETQTVTDDRLFTSFANSGRSRQLSISAYLNLTPSAKTSLSVNVEANWDYRHNPSLGAKLHRWNASFIPTLTQQLPWKLRFSANVYWPTGWVWDLYTYSKKKLPWYGLSLTRTFLKDDRLTVKFYTRNPFGRLVTEVHTIGGGVEGFNRQRSSHQHIFGITVGYRFGSLNSQVKRTAATIENTDLQGRKK